MKKVTNKEIINGCINVLENSNYRTEFGMRPINRWSNGKGFGWTFDKKIKMIFTFTIEKMNIKVIAYSGDSYGKIWDYDIPSNATANNMVEMFEMEFQKYLTRVGF